MKSIRDITLGQIVGAIVWGTAIAIGGGGLWITTGEPANTQGRQQSPASPNPTPAATPPIPTPTQPGKKILGSSSRKLTSGTKSNRPRILKLAVSLSRTADLKVAQGDRVEQGQLISDRDRERDRLSKQLQGLKFTLQRVTNQKPLAPIAPKSLPAIPLLPPATNNRELVEVQEADENLRKQKDKISALSIMSADELPPEVLEHERAIATKLNQTVEQAKGTLNNAGEERKREEYRHSLELAQREEQIQRAALEYQRQLQTYQESTRDREVQLAELQARIQDADQKLQDLAIVRSPYPGIIRRIKYVGQTDVLLQAEITLLVDGLAPDGATGAGGTDSTRQR